MGSISVERPQDLKFKGNGLVTIVDSTATGIDSSFIQQLSPGAKIVVKVNDEKVLYTILVCIVYSISHYI